MSVKPREGGRDILHEILHEIRREPRRVAGMVRALRSIGRLPPGGAPSPPGPLPAAGHPSRHGSYRPSIRGKTSDREVGAISGHRIKWIGGTLSRPGHTRHKPPAGVCEI